MARLSRVVVPGVPHHITQRGNRGQAVFFSDADYQLYRDLIAEGCRKAGVEIWAYCLMPDRVHLIAVPPEADSLRAAIADAHRRYARTVNAREDLTGHLWQDRFGSFPMDEAHAIIAARYIERNPVSAGITTTAAAYRWSSAQAHLSAMDDGLVRVGPLLEIAGGAAVWGDLLAMPIPEGAQKAIALHETTGRPLGAPDFVAMMEKKTGRKLAPGKRGPKPRKT